jgi:hypothetical protein
VPCRPASPKTTSSLFPSQPKKEVLLQGETYLKARKTEVTNLNIHVLINKDVVAFDVSVDDPEGVHIGKDSCCFFDDTDSLLGGDLYLLFEMQEVIEGAV